MMRNAIAIEFYKERHVHTWLLPCVFTGVILLWQFFLNHDLSEAEQMIGYTNVLYQIPVMNGLFMPLMIAVLASRLCDMEIKGDTLKQLYTLQGRSVFYCFKFLHESFYLLMCILGECFVVILCGKIFQFKEALSLTSLLQFAGTTLVTGLIILSLQHFLSLYFSNQIMPLIVGLAGSFLGLFSMFMPPIVSRWIIYSYFAAFMTAEMNWNSETREIWYTPIDFPVLKLLLLMAAGAVFFVLCLKKSIDREV